MFGPIPVVGARARGNEHCNLYTCSALTLNGLNDYCIFSSFGYFGIDFEKEEGVGRRGERVREKQGERKGRKEERGRERRRGWE